MRPPAVVEVEVAADGAASFADAVVGPEIHFFVFDAAPEPLDDDIVSLRPFGVHADRYAVVGEHAGECRACPFSDSAAN